VSAPSAMRWRVESWDPGYGASTEDQAELGRSDAQVTPDVEVPESRWRPIDPDPGAVGWAAVLFVDGVRRIDAMAWISEPDGVAADGAGSGVAALALCASYAAGVVRCRPGGADLVAAEVRRGLFSTAEHATDVVTTAGRYQRVHTAQRGEPVADLSLAVQRALGDVEAAVAATARTAVGGSDASDASDDGEDLLVLDGPLRGRQHLPRVLGFIKTHRSEYLPPALHRVVGTLAPGQRTPVFGLGTSWQRHTWYLKLPGSAAPWAGVVRVECSAELSVAQVVELADRSAPMFCRYASTEYKDSRAPQNLYPIAGLERALRRRLGDQALLYRAIRRASAGLNSS
jgi:hypothetical protein